MTIFFLASPAGLLAQDCGDWMRITSPNVPAEANFLGGIDGVTDDDVWTVGWYRNPDPNDPSDYEDLPTSVHWDGNQWNQVPVPIPPFGNARKFDLLDVTAVSSDEVWAVGGYIPPGNVNVQETLSDALGWRRMGIDAESSSSDWLG